MWYDRKEWSRCDMIEKNGVECGMIEKSGVDVI
jgi:hypothetical protein